MGAKTQAARAPSGHGVSKTGVSRTDPQNWRWLPSFHRMVTQPAVL